MSILTNTSAMVALSTLRSINSNLADVQSQISTGQKVANSADNAAIFAAASVIRSDVAGFEALNDGLSLGKATISVARNGAEQVADLLTEIKGKITAATADNIPADKIQADIVELRNQITSIVGAAQLNGLNLLDGSVASTTITSSLNRAANGVVTTGTITVNAQNLDQGGTALTAADATGGSGAGTIGAFTGAATTDTVSIDVNGFLDTSGSGTAGTVALAADTGGVNDAVTGGFRAGDQLAFSIDGVRGVYTVAEGDNAAAVTAGLRNALIDAGLDTSRFSLTFDGAELDINNLTNEDNVAYAFSVERDSGLLAGLSTLDVTTNLAGAQAAIDPLINAAVDAAAAFGSSENRVVIQQEFVKSLIDSFNTGIGALVDADLEAASARLQALQVQQQLASQALSIANAGPQNILALFR